MNSNEQKILLNQVRHRILQFVAKNGRATSREIGQELCDIPQASLYRQIKTLNDSGFLQVIDERRVRGTLESTYQIAPALTGDDSGRSDLSIQFALLSIAQEFDQYDRDNNQNGLLDFSSLPVFMSDEEYSNYVADIVRLTQKYTEHSSDNKKRCRRVTFVSSPA